MNHLRKSPGSEGRHEHRCPKADMVEYGKRKRLGLLRNSFKSCRSAANLLAAQNGDYKQDNACKHYKALNKVCFERCRVAAEDNDNRRRKRNNYHADVFRNVKNNAADACQSLIDRSGIRNKKNEDDGNTKILHTF